LSLVSIIIPCKNEGDLVEMTLNSMDNAKTGIDYEIIVVDDGSVDGCCGFLRGGSRPEKLVNTSGLGACQARNEGARSARGEILVFCDGHVLVEDNWLDGLVEVLNRPGVGAVAPAIGDINRSDAVGYGQTWNENLENKWLPWRNKSVYTVPLIPGGCMAISREAFETIGGFDKGFKVWGHEDEEISLKLWLFGYKIYIHSDVLIRHYFRPKHPYSVSILQVNYNFFRMVFSHLSEKRAAKAVDQLRESSKFSKVITEVIFSDVWKQRQDYFTRRQKSDDWFFTRFSIPF